MDGNGHRGFAASQGGYGQQGMVAFVFDPAVRGRGEVDFGGSGILAANAAVCSTACSTAQTVQLDNFLTSPHGEFNSTNWSAANVSGYGQQGIAAFVLDNTYERELGGKEYAQARNEEATNRQLRRLQLAQKPLKSLGNVRVVISDIKHSDASSGTPTDFMADVLVIPLREDAVRDHYPGACPEQGRRGMEIPLREDAVPGAVYQGDYRYGFNGMSGKKRVEAASEVKGEGMSYTAMYWEYDPRLGRRWETDPVLSPKVSEYSTFSNNPIIFTDPDGNADYYSQKGKFIGSDGNDDGRRFMAFSRSTSKKIEMNLMYKEYSALSTYSGVARIPSQDILAKMVEMTKYANDENVEYGITVGIDSKKTLKPSKFLKSTDDIHRVNLGPGIKELEMNNLNYVFSVHVHQAWKGSNPVEGGDVPVHTADPSFGDVDQAKDDHSGYPSYCSDGFTSMVIGPVWVNDAGQNSNGTFNVSTTKYGNQDLIPIMKISIFNQNNNVKRNPADKDIEHTPMIPSGSMDFDQYINATTKANKDYEKRHR